jgi:hypothetical protein
VDETRDVFGLKNIPAKAVEPEPTFLGDVQRLSLKPGDVVVMYADSGIDDDTAEKLKLGLGAALEGWFGRKHGVMILTDGLKIGVIGAEPAAQVTQTFHVAHQQDRRTIEQIASSVAAQVRATDRNM